MLLLKRDEKLPCLPVGMPPALELETVSRGRKLVRGQGWFENMPLLEMAVQNLVDPGPS